MKYSLIIGIFLLVISCGESDSGDKPIEAGAGTREVMAVIGAEEITRQEIERELSKLSYKEQKIYNSSPQKLNEFLESYINQRVLYNEASKRGIPENEDILEKTKEYKHKLIRQAIGEEIINEIKANDAGMKKYYDEHKEQFEELEISQIFIKMDGVGERVEDSAAHTAEIVSERAAGGESFTNIAEELNIEYKNGGTDTISRRSFPPKISESIFALKEGEVSNPLEVNNGFLIIKVEEKKGAPPFNEINKKTEAYILNQILYEYVDSLKKEQGVQIYIDNK